MWGVKEAGEENHIAESKRKGKEVLFLGKDK